MMDRFPEISVAPGEGQRPKGILGDKHWDVKAFPHLHNPDGSNGKDQFRETKLTDKNSALEGAKQNFTVHSNTFQISNTTLPGSHRFV